MQKFANMHFTGPHPADMTPESALPSILLWDWIDEFMRFFEVEGAGRDWYPDQTFADLDLFRRATVALATAALGPGTLERYRQEEEMPVAYATTVAEYASVNPRTLGAHIRVEGSAVLARRAGEGGGSPLSGVRELRPI